MVRLADRPDMTLDVYRGRKTTTQQEPMQITVTMKIIYRNPYQYKWINQDDKEEKKGLTICDGPV